MSLIEWIKEATPTALAEYLADIMWCPHCPYDDCDCIVSEESCINNLKKMLNEEID